MLEELRMKIDINEEIGNSPSDIHVLSFSHKSYYMELAEAANIDNIPDVYADIFTESLSTLNYEPMNFRKYKYSINKDNQTFTKEKEEEQ